MKKILIIEDDAEIVEIMQIVLEGEGYQVFAVSDGEKAVAAERKINPDLVLLDLWVPGVKGEKIAEKIKSRRSDLPIIVVSAQDGLPQTAKKIKADGFLPKPFDLKNLTGILEKHLN